MTRSALPAVISLPSTVICDAVIFCRNMGEAISTKLVLRKRGPDLPPRRIMFGGS
ncbi:hypothetical protein PA08_0382 [Cutibacterium modestum P08]|nr:hypothetical protein PA08_0382 [Cutibacterium modestum P08]